MGRLNASAEADPEQCAGISAVAQQVELENATAMGECYRQYCLAHEDINTQYCHENATVSECISGCSAHWFQHGKYEVNRQGPEDANPWVCMHMTGMPLRYIWFDAARPDWNGTSALPTVAWSGVRQPTEVYNARVWGGNHFATMEVVAVPRIVCGNYDESQFTDSPVHCADCDASMQRPGAVCTRQFGKVPGVRLLQLAPTVPPTVAGIGQQCGQYHYMVAGERVSGGQPVEQRVRAELTSVHNIDLAEKLGGGLPDEFDEYVGRFLRGDTQAITSSASRRSSDRSLLQQQVYGMDRCPDAGSVNVTFVVQYGHLVVFKLHDEHEGLTNNKFFPAERQESGDSAYKVVAGGFWCPVMEYYNSRQCTGSDYSQQQLNDHVMGYVSSSGAEVPGNTVLSQSIDDDVKTCNRIAPSEATTAFYITMGTVDSSANCLRFYTIVKCHHTECAQTVFRVGSLSVLNSDGVAHGFESLIAQAETFHTKTQSSIGQQWQMRTRCPAVECQGPKQVVCASDPVTDASDPVGSFTATVLTAASTHPLPT